MAATGLGLLRCLWIDVPLFFFAGGFGLLEFLIARQIPHPASFAGACQVAPPSTPSAARLEPGGQSMLPARFS